MSPRCVGVQVVVCLLLVGCSDDDKPAESITASQSQAIWSSSYVALQAVETQMIPDMQAKDAGKGDLPGDGGLLPKDGGLKDRDGGLKDRDGGGSGWITGTISSFQVNGVVSNPGGSGTATVTGSGGKRPTGWGVTLTITFSGWDTGAGIVISGPLTLTYDLTSLTPVTMTLLVKGTLTAKIGPLPLPAVVDVKVTVSGTTTVVCGTVAGNPVGSGSCP